MKDARELLAQLRAAGVEPMSNDEILGAAGWALTRMAAPVEPTVENRLVADLLEAQARLAELREWAEKNLAAPPPLMEDERWAYDTARREVLRILDGEAGDDN